MYRIGILGTENSHAAVFADIVCGQRALYPDFKITALYALEKAPSNVIAAAHPDAGIRICDSAEEMLPLVDCVMVTARHGKYHRPFAEPFIKAGMPAFIDKPFAIDFTDAQAIIDEAAAVYAPLTGGSGVKYSDEIKAFKASIDAGEIGHVSSAMMTFAVDLKSVYGGFYFYASHLTEMMTAVFGNDVRTVRAFVKNDHLMAVARYDALDMVMNFEGSSTAVAYGDKGYLCLPVTCDHIFDCEFAHFAEMVRTGASSMTAADLLTPVRVMNAIDRSMSSGREETV